MGFKIQHLGSKLWNRSNGPSRPHSTQTFTKFLKEGIKPSREKPLHLGVCLKLTNLVPTHRPLRVEQFSFLSRRPPTVGSRIFLKRSQRLSLWNHHFRFSPATASPSLHFTFWPLNLWEMSTVAPFCLLVT